MSDKQNTQVQEIVSSVGTRCVARFAGIMGDARYFECKDPITNKTIGFIAQGLDGKCGPLCTGYIEAALRLRNIEDSKTVWWTRLFSSRQK